MQTALNQTINTTYAGVQPRASVWTRFMNYCKEQEANRLLWLGIILAIHGCVLTPITIMVTLFAGPNFFLFMTGIAAMGLALVTNLAAMPTKVTIPAFAISAVVDIAIISSCVFSAL